MESGKAFSVRTAAAQLHSRYDPVREAERFVDQIETAVIPKFIVISEPGQSYLQPALRHRFPDALLIALRYTPDLFRETDKQWNAVWRPDDTVALQSFLSARIMEDDIPLSLFIPWKIADSFWPEAAAFVWNTIADFIRLSTSVLSTRGHFGRRWLKNSFRNACRIRDCAILPVIKQPILLALSGPGLEPALPVDNGRFFVLAVSSALRPLSSSATRVDLCIATDGGYWAERHLDWLPPGVPLAVPLEAAVPTALFSDHPILPLSYGSQLESELFEIIGCIPRSVPRNGSVAGTAAVFALNHSTECVYASGLDLAVSPAFAHARPHTFDELHALSVSRLQPLATVLAQLSFSGNQHEMYASWFAGRDASFKARFIRLRPIGRDIPQIRSCALSDIISGSHHPLPFRSGQTSAVSERVSGLLSLLEGIGRVLQGPDSIALSAELLAGKTVVSEFVQMAAYGGLLKLNKASRQISADSQALDTVLDEIRTTSTRMIAELKRIVQRGH